MGSVLKDRFILLKTVKYGESDLILHGLSKTCNKIGFIAKGARKSKKRFGGGVLEPTHYVELTYKSSSMATEMGRLLMLNEAQLINGFVGIRSDYDRLQMALYFVQLIDKVSMEGLDDGDYAFNLLGNTLRQLETSDYLQLLKTQFEVKFLHQQGVLPPEVSHKDFIGRPIDEHVQLTEYLEGPRKASFQKLRGQLNQFIHSYVG